MPAEDDVISLDVGVLEAAVAAGTADAWDAALRDMGWPGGDLPCDDPQPAVEAWLGLCSPSAALNGPLAVAQRITPSLPMAIVFGFVSTVSLVETLATSIATTSWFRPVVTLFWGSVLAGVVGLRLLARQHQPRLEDGTVGPRLLARRREVVRQLAEQPFVTVVGSHILENHPGAAKLRVLADNVQQELMDNRTHMRSLRDMLRRLEQGGLGADDPQHQELRRAIERQQDIQKDHEGLLRDIQARQADAHAAHERLRGQARQLRLRQQAAGLMQDTDRHHDQDAAFHADLEVEWLDLSSRHEHNRRQLVDMGARLATHAEMRQTR